MLISLWSNKGELSRVRDLLDVLQEETFSICLGNLVNQMHGKIVSRLPGAVSGPEKPLLRDIPNLIDRGFFEKNIGLNPEYYDMIPQLQRVGFAFANTPHGGLANL